MATEPDRDDVGGDAPCWAHLFADDALPDTAPDMPGTVVDLGATDTRGRDGVVWSLPHGGDLDANLVRLGGGGGIGRHVNDEVDVIVSVIAGRGLLLIDDVGHDLRGDVLASIPKGSAREIRAGADGLTYLSIHRRRRPLGVGSTTGGTDVAR